MTVELVEFAGRLVRAAGRQDGRPELEMLFGPDVAVPPDVVAQAWAGGVVWMTAAEAAARLPTGVPKLVEKIPAGRVDCGRSRS
jgi:hypothetical protein